MLYFASLLEAPLCLETKLPLELIEFLFSKLTLLLAIIFDYWWACFITPSFLINLLISIDY